MTDTDPAVAVAAAVKSARRAVSLTLIAVAVAVVVLAIDHGIKRSIIDEAQRMRGLLDELKTIMREVASEPGPGEVAAGSSHGADTAGHVDDAPRTSAAADPDEVNGTRPAGRAPRGQAGRSRGNGQ